MRIESESTVLAVANTIALVQGIVAEVMGNEVASTLNGNELNQTTLAQLVGSEIEKKFLTHRQPEPRFHLTEAQARAAAARAPA